MLTITEALKKLPKDDGLLPISAWETKEFIGFNMGFGGRPLINSSSHVFNKKTGEDLGMCYSANQLIVGDKTYPLDNAKYIPPEQVQAALKYSK